MTDDQGWGDIGYNNPVVKTPLLDSLAAAGIILENFYVSPTCSPTRASLLTGKYANRVGVYHTYEGGAMLDPDAVTLAEILVSNGYRTGIFGKWHLGDSYPYRPIDRGFQESVIHKSGGIGQIGDIENYHKSHAAYFGPVLYRNEEAYKSNQYCADEFTDQLIDFIQRGRDSSFFCMLSFNTPHVPLQVADRYVDIYKDLEEDSMYDMEATRKVYGMLSNIDNNMRKLISYLGSAEILKHTMVLFLSDNGPAQLRFNGGLRDIKGSVYEGGIKVPAFVFGNELKPKSIDHNLAHIDILPTILEVCGIEGDHQVDGISFLPVLESSSKSPLPERPLYFQWNKGYPVPGDNMAVIMGNYKLVMQDKRAELYELKSDPQEIHNISLNEKEKAGELEEMLQKWFEGILSDGPDQPGRIVIGSPYDRQVILNLDEAITERDIAVPYWNIHVSQSGHFAVTAHFLEEISDRDVRVLFESEVDMDMAPVKISKQELYIEDLFLRKGNYEVSVVDISQNLTTITPFYLQINSLNNDESSSNP